MRALCVVHRGITCALPSHQVARASSIVDDAAPELLLWDGDPSIPADRFLRVEVPPHSGWLRCSDVRIVDVEAPSELSPLVRALTDLPHVVGWTDLGGQLVWLVDLHRMQVG